MNIKLTAGGVASQDEISTLEHIVGRQLPPDILHFVTGNDGAKIETNIFKIGPGNESGVNGFIPVNEIAGEMKRINDLPSGYFPIAWTEGGNYVIVNSAAPGAVFFWDHEMTDGIVKLADNLRSFLDLLEPFDVNSIKLRPGQVKKAWIDPDFLKKLQG